MRDFSNKEVIFWDFDGVIIDSEEIRILGFKKVLNDYPRNEVEKLIQYHLENGGISRYVKFRYFFQEIRKTSITDHEIDELSAQFSKIMREKLTNKDILIDSSLNFIKNNFKKIKMHIVSGSDEAELHYLCGELEIRRYFISINGSPTPKIDLVESLLRDISIQRNKIILIGDSINDYEAANKNNIEFFGFNNPKLKQRGLNYIESFE